VSHYPLLEPYIRCDDVIHLSGYLGVTGPHPTGQTRTRLES